MPGGADQGFHDYAFVWEANRIRYYVDGKLVHTVTDKSAIPSHPQKIFASLWASGKFASWLGRFEYPGHPVTMQVKRIAFTALGQPCQFKGSVACKLGPGFAVERRVTADMLRILYLVHDLNDPAVRRRVLMLQAGGAEVVLAGFSRKANPLALVEGITPIDLGRTHDGRFLHRLASVGRAAFTLSGRLDRNFRPDIVIGRNLEMLALAHRANALLGGSIPVVYECLDIHRLMLRGDVTGQALRAVERRLARRSALLVTSSPAFVRNYFERFGQADLPWVLLENKVLDLADDRGSARFAPTPPPAAGEPWRIGWFGALRCRKSLELLARLAGEMKGRVEIILRGRPARDQFDDFDRQVAEAPHLTFAGPYRNPEDLPRIYGDVHFSWLPDFFEEGMNSAWLLPNRLYEGCCYSTVPLAMAGTETARFLEEKGLGFTIAEPSSEALSRLAATMHGSGALRRGRRTGEAAGRRLVAPRPCGLRRFRRAVCAR